MLEKLARISPTFQNFFNWPRKLQYYKIQVIPIVPNISDDSFHSPMILRSNIVNLDSDAKAIAES